MIRYLLQVDSIYFAGSLSVVPAQRTSGDFEKPGSKQSTVSKLVRFAVHNQHHFLGQVFAQGLLAATRTKKGDQLRSEDCKHGGERVLAWEFQELLRGRPLLNRSLTYHRLVDHADC